MEINRRKIKAKYESENPPDFITHLNYISCLNTLSKGLEIECKSNITNKISENKNLGKKLSLINLTNKNLKEEYKIISENPDFAEVCVPWIAVKSYYLLFNLFLISKYLLTSNESAFNSAHKSILKDLKEFIKRGEICFNNDLFNKVYDCIEVKNFKAPSGYNIRFSNIDIETRLHQVLKKLLLYKIEDFKREKKINNFRKKKDKQILNDFIQKSNLNTCEFFYWYRIKSNYRDLEFLDKDIKVDQFRNFYKNYYELTDNFYKAFKKLVNDLSKKRLGKEILL